METFGKICFTFGALIITTLIGGYVFMNLWEWLIVYAFNVQHLTLTESIGIAFFIAYLNPKKKDEEKLTMDKLYEIFIWKIIWSAVVLGIGWLITLFH